MNVRFAFTFLLFLTLKGTAQLFRPLAAQQTGIGFANYLHESPEQNIIAYEYFYNGGGVGIGDFDNDGLADIYFTANMDDNKLYKNNGNFTFTDITKSAGVAGRRGWKTGVSVADVNGDGWLDIYVCYSGNVDRKQRHNQLFINNHNLTFTDRAAEMGLNDAGFTTHAVFFDFDLDNDLDCFVLNHNNKSLRNFDAAFVKKMVDEDAGDRLYLNEGNKFTDISMKAGIIANPLGYGLSAVVSDINNDGWPDLYVTNDYVEEDYLYINNGNGTFTDRLKEQMGHISNFSMGCDIADINNDGLQDIFTLDMLPQDNKRQKLLYMPDNYELYGNQLKNGFHHQLMRNMLQVNNGNGSFSEIGQLSGVSNTDWSWASLFSDFNNDGNKDLFVTNGYGRDMTNRDFVKFYANERLKYTQGKTDERMFKMLRGIKSTPLRNYIFENTGKLHFADRTKEWGFNEDGFSQGAAIADLDNDGDMDIVINRINQEAGIYQNTWTGNGSAGQFISLNLRMEQHNHFAVGARVVVYCGSRTVTYENYPARGFQSSMQTPLHIGLPGEPDSLIVQWPDRKLQVVRAIISNKRIDIRYAPNLDLRQKDIRPAIFKQAGNSVPFRHREDEVNDFKIQPLMPNMLSYSGPRIAKADVNKDGLEDIFFCGAKNQQGRLLLQTSTGDFQASEQLFKEDLAAEDTDALFFDADGDGDSDLYIVSGGYACQRTDPALQDRLYINEGGKFSYRKDALPQETSGGSCVRVADMDGDGDLDIFTGGRAVPGRYPESPESLLLENDGKGIFRNVIVVVAPALQSAGMITDAAWLDINKDGRQDLVVCGEWMPIRFFINESGTLVDRTQQVSERRSGWWNALQLADLDRDGDLDIVAGNWGSNSQIKASAKEPVTLYYGDFDQNGSIEPLICYFINGKSYPMASRDDITDQMTSLRQRFPTYDSYSDAGMEEILNNAQSKDAVRLEADYMNSAWLENDGGKFLFHELPMEAGFAPVYAIAVDDFNGDGHPDILLGGNIEQTRIKIGRIDANYGMLFTGDGKGGFNYVPQLESGLKNKDCTRAISIVNTRKGRIVIFGNNNQVPTIYHYQPATSVK